MTDPRFVHLRVHSEYSISDSIVRLDALVAAAAADAQPAVAVTDLGNLYGWVKFYKAARGKGVKPICGADCWWPTTPTASARRASCCSRATATAICACASC